MRKFIRLLMIFLVVFCLNLLLGGCNNKNQNTELTSIGSKKNLQNILKQYRYNPLLNFSLGMKSSAPMEDASKESTPDYSKTNTQIEGIDEADLVKTDGEFIYSISGNSVVITKAYPVSELSVYKVLNYENNIFPSMLYVDEQYLIVICYNNISNYKDVINIYLYKKNDYKTPINIVELDGYMVTSRKINNELLIITNKYIYNTDVKNIDDNTLPSYKINSDKTTINYKDIYYKDGTMPDSFVSIYKFDITNISDSFKSYTYLGSSHNVYVSYSNIYVAQNVYNVFGIEKLVKEPRQQSQTVITKISFNSIDSSKSITVKGTINNQFSMDEYKTDFRITTTDGLWSRNSSNNLYIYNEDLQLKGKIENIAPSERIQSTRFVGEKIYLVTFRQVDPFFVIDASDASNPKILGELKIPGFSTYLHPYDENHIIGFGFETEEVYDNYRTFTRVIGTKMAVFDVTNPNNPTELFKELILYGNNGYNNSELAYNHKALLFNKNKKIFAFPITSNSFEKVIIKRDDNTETVANMMLFKQSYLVYNLDLETGFNFKIEITHNQNIIYNDYVFGSVIMRGLYIDNYLYTVSQNKIQVHSLGDFSLIKEVSFN